jgi:WD40 repeat protein
MWSVGRGGRRRPEGVLIIFDQFEEVLTAEPLGLAARREFFAQLGELLLNPMVWGLFSLREDYLAPLDPYVQAVPTHLKNRYRMDLLTREAAREAIVGPAERRVWTEAAVDRLVRDLATVKVQQPDGTFVEETGVYVEPMQLQVVCRGLWERMPADDLSVDPEDVAAFGDVTRALGRYYADEVGRVAGGDEREERGLREWVGERLISIDGIRTPVLRSAGGRDASIGRLVDAHLVRAEHRGGAVWYELAHDRLVGPVRADNERWAQAHLRPVQVQAALWARQGKPAALLLSEAALLAAERWAAQHSALAEADAEFMAASRAVRGQERAVREAQARASAQQRVFTWIVGVLGVVAVAVAAVAVVKNWEANEQAALALKNAEAADLETARTRDQGRLVAIRDVAGDPTEQAALLREAERPAEMRQWLQVATEVRQQALALAVLMHTGAAPPAISPDGRAIVTTVGDEWWLWNVERGQASRLGGHAGAMVAYDFSPDGRRMVLASKEGATQIWSTSGGAPISLPAQRYVRAVAFSPDGTRVATAAEQGSVMLWSVDGGEPVTLAMPGLVIYSLAFAPDGRSLLTRGAGQPWVWPIEGFTRATLLDTKASVRRVWFARDGRHVLAEGDDDKVWVWPSAGGEPRALPGTLVAESADGRGFMTKEGATYRLWSNDDLSREIAGEEQFDVAGVFFSPDGAKVVERSLEGLLAVRDVASGGSRQLVWTGVMAAFSPDGLRFVTTNGNAVVRVLRAGDGGLVTELRARAGSVTAAVFSPDGSRVLGWGNEGAAYVWRADGECDAVVFAGHRGEVTSAGFSADGRYVWTVEGERTVRVWRVPEELPARPRAPSRMYDEGALSADWRRVALSGEVGKEVQVWEAEGGEPREIGGSGSPEDVRAMAFSADGERLVVGYTDGWARIWRVAGEGASIKLEGHDRPIEAVAFSPDGTRVITGSRDLTARVWSADEGGPRGGGAGAARRPGARGGVLAGRVARGHRIERPTGAGVAGRRRRPGRAGGPRRRRDGGGVLGGRDAGRVGVERRGGAGAPRGRRRRTGGPARGVGRAGAGVLAGRGARRGARRRDAGVANRRGRRGGGARRAGAVGGVLGGRTGRHCALDGGGARVDVVLARGVPRMVVAGYVALSVGGPAERAARGGARGGRAARGRLPGAGRDVGGAGGVSLDDERCQ